MPNPLTRRASIAAGITAAALLATTRNANAVTENDDYHPSDYTAQAIGATPDGWIDQSGPTWDDTASVHNNRDTENRANALHAHHRDGIDALITALAPPTAAVRIMCVGDSITVGAGSTSTGGNLDPTAGYIGRGQGYRPWLTSNLLRRRIDAQLTVVAQGGQTLRTMTPPTLAALPTARPDIVLIHLGTNDIGGANDFTADWGQRYGNLLDQILASSPTVRIACALLPTYRGTLGTRVPALNQAITDAINTRKGTGRVTTADLTDLSTHWTADGYHPLEAGYLDIAYKWTAAITPWLPN